MLLGPTSVKTSISGCKVEIDCKTDYPFSEYLVYSIKSGCDFTFAIRVPAAWTNDPVKKPSLVVGKGEIEPLYPDTAGLHRVPIQKGNSTLTVHFPMSVHTVLRNGSVGIYYGPLLFGADIDYTSTSHQPLNWTDRSPLDDSETDSRSRDYVLEPTVPWQYAIDPSTVRVEKLNKSVSNPVWTMGGPSTVLWVDAYPIEWPQSLGTADLPPLNQVVKRATKTSLRMIPFGAAKLHIAQFPVAAVED